MQASPGPASRTTSPTGQVICLCAAWCGVCRDWTALFDALGASYPQLRFDWVDVEDEADAIGDLDIETFPTLLVADDDGSLFFGPVVPSVPQVARLLDNLFDPGKTRPTMPVETRELLRRLRPLLLRKR